MTNSVKLKIKRVYKGENLNYTVGVAEEAGIYVMEVIDTTGFIMGIPGKTDKDKPAVAFFGISEEEFNLKDTDTVKLDDLAFELMHKIPMDRLLAENNLRKEGRCQTIDDGKYAKLQKEKLEDRKKKILSESAERAKKLIAEMMQSGEGYYLYTQGAGNKLPTIDNSGAVQIFTKEEYANAVMEKVQEVPLACEKLDKNGLGGFFRNLFRYGVPRIKVNMLLPEGGEIMRDDAVKLGNVTEYGLVNSRVYSLMIRYLQAKRLKNETDSKLSSMTLWSAFCKEFPKSLFFIPMIFEDDPADITDDKNIYFTENAVKEFKEKKPVVLGIEKYKPADAGGKVMKLITLKNDKAEAGSIFLPLFTDIFELKAVFGEKCRLCVITYDDLLEKYKACTAVVVNPASLNLVITQKGMENIEEEKEGPVKIYKKAPEDETKQ